MDVVKLWRCPTCNRVLRERTVARLSEPLGDPLDGALLLAGLNKQVP